MNTFTNDIAVIGIGRVGLPLALTICEAGFKTIGVDIDTRLIEQVNQKIFPFHEPGYPELIKRVDLFCTSDTSAVADCENIIITVGTPLLSHIETDLSQVTRVISSIVPYISRGHNIILRSTLAPKTTRYVKNMLEQKTGFKIGSEIFLSFCPERLAEGKAMKELRDLPQIIGSEDSLSGQKAEKIFEKVAVEVIHTDFISAELVKLFNNISRYVHFSVANQLAYIADNFGANIYDIIHMTNHKYPRGVIPQPGMTAGTCLRKDFGMINETIPYTDLLLSAWKVNEFTPKFLVDNMKRRTPILNKKIAVLGYTFKNDVDDTRDSLIPKLIRYIERENPASVKVHEPNIEGKLDLIYDNFSLEDALEDAEIIFFAINHSEFKNNIGRIFDLSSKEAWFSDIWNIGGAGSLFYQNPKSK